MVDTVVEVPRLSTLFYFAKRRCPDCDYWPGFVKGGYQRGNIKYYVYTCRQCGKCYTRQHHISLRQLISLVFYSTLFFKPVKRDRLTKHRQIALYAIRDITETMVRKMIIQLADLW